MRIHLKKSVAHHAAGAVLTVKNVIPHGGHSDSEKQYVLNDGTIVLSDNADVLPLDFDDYQKAALSTALYRDSIDKLFADLGIVSEFGPKSMEALRDLFRLQYATIGLGEAGEVQNKVKKIIRDGGGRISQERRQAVKKELGGLLWYVATTAAELKLALSDVAESNIEELSGRKDRGTLHGDGDDR